MPIYEYECGKCGKVFEILQKASDPPPKKHECGSRRIRRVLSPSAFVFKGEGWYVTDYSRKDKEKKERSKKKKGDSDTSSEKSETKSDKSESKPAAAPDKGAKSQAA